MTCYSITIGRQMGAGGRTVGRILADKLGFTYLDKEILNMAAKESGYSEKIFEQKDEKRDFLNFAFHLVLPYFTSKDMYSGQLTDEALFCMQSDAMKKVAAEKNCIFIGRASDYVLRHHPHCVNVFLCADLEERVAHIMARDGVTEKEAKKKIERSEKEREEFYNFYSPKVWGEAQTYDLCVNTSKISMEEAACVIEAYVRKRFPQMEAAK